MRRLSLLTCGMVAALALASPATAGAPRTHTVNASVQGAVVRLGSPAVSAFLVRDTALGGSGAGRLSLRSDGIATATAYMPAGTIRMRMRITFGAPNGTVVPFTGSGEATGGTGRFRGATGDVTVTGTQNTEELTFTARITGPLRW